MSHKKWTAQEKFQIVMSGLKGQRIAELCNEYGISQGQYYKWRASLGRDLEKRREKAEQRENPETAAQKCASPAKG